MLRVRSYEEVITAVYGKQWREFSDITRANILKLLRYWDMHNGISIQEDITAKLVYDAINHAMIDSYNESLDNILKGDKSHHYFDLRTIAFKILSDKTEMPESDMSIFLGGARHRSTIYHGLQKFDQFYEFDRKFKDKYDNILRLTNEYIKNVKENHSDRPRC